MCTRSALIIDDEPDVTTYLGMVLGDHGWRVQTANTADQGLELARQAPPDVVLLDVMMPERGGMSTLVALREDPVLSEIPIIFITGIQGDLTRGFESMMHRFEQHRPDAWLEKPVDPRRLVEVLDEILAEHNGGILRQDHKRPS